MDRWVEITFDCLPLRSIGRLDIPIDASPKYRARCERIKTAMEKHGSHNAYYLHNATCRFRVVNHPDIGIIDFTYEGILLTDDSDEKAERVDLQVELKSESCDWINEPIVKWFEQTVSHAVLHEFDRYIAAGDLDAAKKRLEEIQAESDDAGGFVGMYL